MTKQILKISAMAAAMLLCTGAAQAVVIDLAVNGGFETGDLTGWTYYDSTNATNGGLITVTSPGSSSTFAGNTNALVPVSGGGGQNPALKQANLGIGLLTPFQQVTVSFDYRADAVDVKYAALHSEQAGGGASSTTVLLDGPGGPATWTNFTQVVTLGPDVTEGISLELVAICGGVPGCQSSFFWDNISITADVAAVPVPAAVWLFGSGLLGLIGVARRKKTV
jgi:hypothetical protein